MKPLAQMSILIALVSYFITLATACKCWGSTMTSDQLKDWTEQCCANVRGEYVDGDCVADSIADNMNPFGWCCLTVVGIKSDCKCDYMCWPTTPRRNNRRAAGAGLEPLDEESMIEAMAFDDHSKAR
ncbi:hypothetical protein V8F20_008221 [Naviculisporaceae sp. PSN 640]